MIYSQSPRGDRQYNVGNQLIFRTHAGATYRLERSLRKSGEGEPGYPHPKSRLSISKEASELPINETLSLEVFSVFIPSWLRILDHVLCMMLRSAHQGSVADSFST